MSEGVRWGRLLCHVALVALFIAGFLDALVGFDEEDGANIGAGLVLLPLLGLGLPWSLIYIVSLPFLFDSPPEVWLPLSIGPAVLNVALHAVYRVVRWRRIRAARLAARAAE